ERPEGAGVRDEVGPVVEQAHVGGEGRRVQPPGGVPARRQRLAEEAAFREPALQGPDVAARGELRDPLGGQGAVPGAVVQPTAHAATATTVSVMDRIRRMALTRLPKAG